MLPTDKSMIAIVKESGLPQLFDKEIIHSKALRPIHLYFISDEEIKEGDWYYDSIEKKVFHVYKKRTADLIAKSKTGRKKIIATTDTTLGLEEVGKAGYSVDEFHPELSQPSQAFIEEWCKNPVDEVDVEYETVNINHDTEFAHNYVTQPKVDSHNTITIHPIKDSWNREEVEQLCLKAFTTFTSNKRNGEL